MEPSVTYLIIGLIVGLTIGAIAGWLIQRRRNPSTSSNAQLRREHERFKEQVTDHFVETGALVNQLTDSYKEVIDHLRKGVGELVDPETLDQRLPSRGEEAVVVKRIGSHHEQDAENGGGEDSSMEADAEHDERPEPPKRTQY